MSKRKNSKKLDSIEGGPPPETHIDARSKTKLAAFLVIGILTLIYCIGEIGFAVMFHSLVLMSDGFHNLSDVIALYIAFWAQKATHRGMTPSMTYGWARTEIIGGLINGCFLLSLCLYVALESIPKLYDPEPMEAGFWFMVIAGAGLAVNTIGTITFAATGQAHGHSHAGGGGHSHGGGGGHSHGGGGGHSHGGAKKKKAPRPPKPAERVSAPDARVELFSSNGSDADFDAADADQQFGGAVTINTDAMKQALLGTALAFIEPPEQEEDDSATPNGGAGHKKKKGKHEDHDHDHDHDHDAPGHTHSHSHKGTEIKKKKKKSGHSHSHGHDDMHEEHGHEHEHDEHGPDHGHEHSHEHGELSQKSSKGKRDMNVHAVFLHFLGDMISSLMVLGAGVLLHFFPDAVWAKYIDPVSSLLIVILILWTTLPLVKRCATILLQGVPQEIDLARMRARLLRIKGVIGIHDLHVWQLVDGMPIASLHITIEDGVDIARTMKAVKDVLHKYGIHSSAIQPEFTMQPKAFAVSAPQEAAPTSFRETAKALSLSGSSPLERSGGSTTPVPPTENFCEMMCVENCEEDWCCKKPAEQEKSRRDWSVNPDIENK